MLIDTPPTLGMITVNALVASTHILIPIQSSYFALEGTDDLLETIEKIKSRPNPNLQILGVVITLHDKRTTLGKGHPEADRRGLQGKALQDDDLEVDSARGVTRVRESIFTFAPRSSGALEYYSLTEEILSVSKRRGLPETSRMRHDSHFVEQLVRADELPVGRRIPIHLIEANPDQPRSALGDLSDLTKSIVGQGRPRAHSRAPAETTAGSRSSRASDASAHALDAGLTEIPCIEMDVHRQRAARDRSRRESPAQGPQPLRRGGGLPARSRNATGTRTNRSPTP